MPLVRKLHRAGNGAAVRLPKPLLELLDLEAGDAVTIRHVGSQLVLEKAAPGPAKGP